MTSSLDQAQALLDGAWTVRHHSVRAAAWVARSELEKVLADLVLAKGAEPGGATTRSLLSCVEVLYQNDDPQIPFAAQYAWDGLSKACHQHAFAMTPVYEEVASLLETVRQLRQVALSQADAATKTGRSLT